MSREPGPSTADGMRAVVAEAGSAGTDEACLQAYETLRAMVEWLVHGIDDPEGIYPGGGAG